MLHDFFRRLDEAYPALARRLGGRLDIQLPAIAASLLTHVLLLTAFAVVGVAAHSSMGRSLDSRLLSDASLSDFATLDTESALAAIDHTTMAPDPGSTAPTLSPLIVQGPTGGAPAPRADKGGSGPLALATNSLSPTLTAMSLPGAPRLDSSIAIQGTGSEHVGDSEAAVDRIAVEILRKLEKGRTLVVWAFDASGSLRAERQRLAKYIDGVYGHIQELDPEGVVERGGMLTAVVAFGKDRKVLAEPTTERQAIASAIEAVPRDDSGVENVFGTVIDVARRWGRFQKDKDAYRAMLIIVTDEKGDDEPKLEPAIAAAKAASMPVYVLGSPAVFGRAKGLAENPDPATRQAFPRVEIDQGPESLLVETIHLPFWYGGPQFELLDAGFGPWALSRLAGATGGIYFITRMGGTERVTFDPAGMREYKPDWNSRDAAQAQLGKNPFRQAVLNAAQVAQQRLPGMPPLVFPPTDTPQFKEAMANGQELAARTMYTVDEALGPITSVVKRREHEASRRWQAQYDLARGRLLAVKVRCYEYNWACARMRKDAPKFTDPKHNAWRLVPDAEVKSSEKAATAAQEARALLERVVKEHPGTPWDLLARRELRDPFGFRWEEITVPPPPKPREGNENAARKKAQAKAMERPPEPPKL